jgi:hypothetical protein
VYPGTGQQLKTMSVRSTKGSPLAGTKDPTDTVSGPEAWVISYNA